VADQALSLWKDTVMLYLSKCQKDMIWRRLFIIFKDIELNHWNQGVQTLCKEVTVYYERIDSAYWKRLNEEYHETASKDNAARPRSNGIRSESEANKKGKLCGAAESGADGAVLVPSSLVPREFANAQRAALDDKRKRRAARYDAIGQAATRNKQKFIASADDDDSKEDALNIESNENPCDDAVGDDAVSHSPQPTTTGDAGT